MSGTPQDRIDAVGQRVFELFGAVAAAPDDRETGRAADEALRELDRLLDEGGPEATRP
ncbi:hypothetical protein [Streptomyces sp. DH37]|uniref:hypothetical protein n=1 Tax=Streptomyces sp. DH37 TaxID=3040122 RepID=UPI002442E965|nr:hypothetical protein [Streptomyces sp. DH37]MDG9703205.1 hypothetical protein [Streptomyces sp. DH37]